MKKFLSWLIDTYLYDWIVLREDYRQVQVARIGAESYVTRLIGELNELYAEFYGRQFKTYERYGEAAGAELVKTNRVDLREFQYSYHLRIPHAVFYTVKDLAKYSRTQQEVAIAKLTEAFATHMKRNLFHAL
jgi:hypothetical protein